MRPQPLSEPVFGGKRHSRREKRKEPLCDRATHRDQAGSPFRHCLLGIFPSRSPVLSLVFVQDILKLGRWQREEVGLYVLVGPAQLSAKPPRILNVLEGAFTSVVVGVAARGIAAAAAMTPSH